MFKEFELFRLGKYSLTSDSLLFIAILFAVTIGINRLIRFYVRRYIRINGKIDGRINSIVQLFIYFIWLIAIALALRETGIRVVYLLGGSAALLVGLGIGLQDIFRDIVSGIIMLVEGNVRIGDVLELKDTIGKVNSLGLRTTELIARDGVKMIVPNNKLISDQVVNLSHSRKPGRHSVKVTVDFKSDVVEVLSVLTNCLNELKGAWNDEEYKSIARLTDFAPNGYQFELFFWTFEYFRFETIKNDLRFIIYQKFKEKGIKIAFSQGIVLQ